MAAVDEARITLHGRVGYGAEPENTADPIVAGASIVMALQTIVSRNNDVIFSSAPHQLPMIAPCIILDMISTMKSCRSAPGSGPGLLRLFWNQKRRLAATQDDNLIVLPNVEIPGRISVASSMPAKPHSGQTIKKKNIIL
jgi:hypothetical protein